MSPMILPKSSPKINFLNEHLVSNFKTIEEFPPKNGINSIS